MEEIQSEYQKIVAIVDSKDTRFGAASETIDVPSVLANRLGTKRLDYEKVSAQLEKDESGRRVEPSKETVVEAKTQGAQKQQQLTVPKHGTAQERQGAAAGLKKIVGNIGKELEEGISEKFEGIGESGLVMPTLSIQDQLADLEKIGQGLQEGSFTKKQTEVIVREIKWLLHAAAHEDLSKLSESQRDFVQMRDQKVKEIKIRLNIK